MIELVSVLGKKYMPNMPERGSNYEQEKGLGNHQRDERKGQN